MAFLKIFAAKFSAISKPIMPLKGRDPVMVDIKIGYSDNIPGKDTQVVIFITDIGNDITCG